MPVANVYPDVANFAGSSQAKKNKLYDDLMAQSRDAEYKRTGLSRKYDGMKERALTIESQITSKTSEITTYDTVIAALPAGAIKDGFIEKKTLAEQDLFKLNIRARNVGGLALVQTKQEYEQADAEVAFVNILAGYTVGLITPNP